MSIKTCMIKQFFYILALFFLELSVFGQNIIGLEKWIPIAKLIATTIMIVIAAINIISNKVSIREMIAYVILILLGAGILINSNDYAVLLIPLLLLSNAGKEKETILRQDLIIKIAIFAVVFSCFVVGLTGKTEYVGHGVIRNTLGFTHPNALGFMLLSIYMSIIYLMKGYSKKRILLLSLLFILMMEICNSRASELAMVIICLLSVIRNRNGFAKYGVKKKVGCFALVIIAISAPFILTNMYAKNNPIAIRIDDITSRRIKWQYFYSQKYDITVFGNKFITTGAPLDDAYYRYLYKYGIAGLFVCVSMILFGMNNAMNNKDSKLIILLIATILYSTMEWTAAWIVASPLLAIGVIGNNKRNYEGCENEVSK